MVKALVFDVYGTLLDTRSCSLVIMKDALKKCNCSLKPKFVYKEWRKDIENMIKKMDTEKKFKSEGVFFREALGKTLRRLSAKADEKEKMRLYNEVCWGNRSIFPETKEAIKKLKEKYKIFVASNSDTKPLFVDFKRYKLKFDKTITSEMIKFYKPHKQFFERLLKKLKMNKDEIVYIGDTLKNDVSVPKKFGIKTVWINRKNRKRKKNDPKPDFIIKNLNELTNLDLI